MLRPGGALALVWNIRELADPAAGADRRAAARGARRARRPSTSSRGARRVEASPLFGPAEERSFPWETALHARRARRAGRVDQLRRAARRRRSGPQLLARVEARGRATCRSRCRSATAPTSPCSRACSAARASGRSAPARVPRDAAGVPADEAVRPRSARATRSSNAVSAQPSATSSATRSPSKTTGTCVRASGPLLRRPPGRGRARRSRRRGSRPSRSRPRSTSTSTTPRSDVVGVAAAVEDAVDGLERARAHGRRPRTPPTRSRNESGTGNGPPVREVDEHERLLRGRHQHVRRRRPRRSGRRRRS